MNYLIFPLLLFSASLFAEVFQGHCRHRPPTLVLKNDICTGPSIELIEKALARLGHHVEWQAVPWPRSIEMAKVGKVDILPQHSMKPEREAYLNPILYGYRTRTVSYYASASSQIEVNSFNDLRPFKVGALRGSFYSSTFDKANLNKWYVGENTQLKDMLQAQRIDVAITSQVHGTELFDNCPKIRKLSYEETLFNGRYFSIPKSSPKSRHANAIRDVIADMRHDDTIKGMFLAYETIPPVQATSVALRQ